MTDSPAVAPAPEASPTWVEGTVPYAWPWDGRLDGASLVLLLAGWDPAWAARAVAPGPGAESIGAVAENLAALAAAVRAVGGLVVAVDQSDAGARAGSGAAASADGVPLSPEPASAETSSPETGPGLVPEAVAPDAAAPLVVNLTVVAGGVDAFHAGSLDLVLRTRRRTHLLVAGHGLEGPVHSTLRSANDRGYECLLVTDACTALTDDLPPASAHMVTMSGGIFGAVGTTAPVLVALAPTASPPAPT